MKLNCFSILSRISNLREHSCSQNRRFLGFPTSITKRSELVENRPLTKLSASPGESFGLLNPALAFIWLLSRNVQNFSPGASTTRTHSIAPGVAGQTRLEQNGNAM